MNCVNCGKEIEEGSAFCRFCGAKADRSKKCPACGSLEKPDSLFCAQCGQALGPVKEKKNGNSVPDGEKKFPAVEAPDSGRDWENFESTGNWRYCGGWVYCGRFRMTEDQKKAEWYIKKEEVPDRLQFFNVNKHGVVFYAGNCIRHFSLDGKPLHKFEAENCRGLHVFGGEIYYFTISGKTSRIFRCGLDGGGLTEIVSKQRLIRDLFATGQFLRYTYENRNGELGCALVNLKSFESRSKLFSDNGTEFGYWPVAFDIENNIQYTVPTPREAGELGIPEDCVVARELGFGVEPVLNQEAPVVFSKLPENYHSEDFSRFYTKPRFTKEQLIGVSYGHTGKFAACRDYDYNLYGIGRDGTVTFLNGGCGSFEPVSVAGQYVYYQDGWGGWVRVRRDGKGAEESLSAVMGD